MRKKPGSSPSEPVKIDNFKMVFRRISERASRLFGSPTAFFIALFIIVSWALTGFYFEFNDTWQLLINTATTIGTFLMVILIQNTQNRDARSIHLKLDELLRGIKGPRNSFVEIEEETDEELDAVKEEFKKLKAKYVSHLKKDKKKRKH